MSAMNKDSIFLLDEFVHPETGANAGATALDLTMLSTFAAMERTEAQWRALLESVGLELVQLYVYNPHSYETVMDIRMREPGPG